MAGQPLVVFGLLFCQSVLLIRYLYPGYHFLRVIRPIRGGLFRQSVHYVFLPFSSGKVFLDSLAFRAVRHGAMLSQVCGLSRRPKMSAPWDLGPTIPKGYVETWKTTIFFKTGPARPL
jgi:hypothetical protein